MGRVRDVLLKDFWMKAFSLVFAIFLWMSVVGGESGEEFFVVPLTIRNIPENMIISNDVADYVNVRVRGQRGILNSLTAKQIMVELDLKDAKEGENTMTLFPEEVRVPEGVTVVRVSPSQFTIQLRRLTEKQLLVRPVFMGSPPPGYERKAVVNPPRVTVMGLEDTLKNQVEIETRPIDSFGKTRSFSVEAALKPLSANVYIKGPQTVRVDVEIREKRGERTFRGIRVTVRGEGEKVTARPDRVTLTVSGPEKGLSGILPSMIQVVVPPQPGPGEYEVVPQVILPQDFETVRLEPEKIHVKVRGDK